MNLNFSAVLFTLGFLANQLTAGPITQATLPPMTHEQGSLTVVAPDGSETSYSAADLEKFPTYSLTTTTPWREVPAVFEGILLSDVLEANGLNNAANILVTAENDFQTTISKELLDSVQILIATRVDGMPHSRRLRGPIQFVIDSKVFAESPLTTESNLVWMAARIEAQE
jgi:hypothetical protein